MILISGPCLQSLFGLLSLVISQGAQEGSGQRKLAATPVCLRLFKIPAAALAPPDKSAPDSYKTTLKINILPLKGKVLFRAHPRRQRDFEDHAPPITLSR